MAWKIITDFLGYKTRTETDPNADTTFPRYLAQGSQNVFINEEGKVETRRGYTLLGAAGDQNYPIMSDYVWQTNTNTDIPVRVDSNKEMEVYVNGAWRTLITGLYSANVTFTTWWNETEAIDELVFADGGPSLKKWSGAIGEVASATSTVITLTSDAGEARFLNAGTVTINGVDYAYTGVSGLTLTGVTPSAASLTAGNAVIQKVVTDTDTIGATYLIDIVEQRENQIYVGSYSQRVVHISSNSDWQNFTVPSPRAAGQPALITLDKNLKAIIPQEEGVYFAAGNGQWYETTFTQSSDLSEEQIKTKKLKTGAGSAPVSQNAWTEAKTSIAYLSGEPSLDELSRVENFNTPTSQPLSTDVKEDFDVLDRTGAKVRYSKSKIYIIFPAETKVYVYDIAKGFFHAPFILPISSVSEYGDLLIGHSSVKNETYVLNDGFDDNGAPIDFKIILDYTAFGEYQSLKDIEAFYTEIKENPTATPTLYIDSDFEGSRGIQEYDIAHLGEENYVFRASEENGLGGQPFGEEPFGGTENDDEPLDKYRFMHSCSNQTPAYEYRFRIEEQSLGSRMILWALGPNVRISDSDSIDIKADS